MQDFLFGVITGVIAGVLSALAFSISARLIRPRIIAGLGLVDNVLVLKLRSGTRRGIYNIKLRMVLAERHPQPTTKLPAFGKVYSIHNFKLNKPEIIGISGNRHRPWGIPLIATIKGELPKGNATLDSIFACNEPGERRIVVTIRGYDSVSGTPIVERLTFRKSEVCKEQTSLSMLGFPRTSERLPD